MMYLIILRQPFLSSYEKTLSWLYFSLESHRYATIPIFQEEESEMDQSYVLLLIILILGLFSKNDAIAIAGTILILIKLLKLEMVFPKLEAHGLNVGVIILTIAFLAPMASGKYQMKEIIQSLKTPLGISAILSGVFVILLTAKGYRLITDDPTVIIPIVFGSILGLIVFRGVPVGPLIASGLTVVLYEAYKWIARYFT